MFLLVSGYNGGRSSVIIKGFVSMLVGWVLLFGEGVPHITVGVVFIHEWNKVHRSA